jgi:hypothetical protein
MTVQTLYTQYLDGKITESKFLYEVRRDQNLDMISHLNSFNDTIRILKNKSLISEKAHKEAKKSEGKQEVEIISKTIDMVNPYEYARGIDYELEIMDVPASSGNLENDNVLKAQKKVLANLTKNPQFYFEKLNGKNEVTDEWVEVTKKEIDKIGKGKSKIIREDYFSNYGMDDDDEDEGEEEQVPVRYRDRKDEPDEEDTAEYDEFYEGENSTQEDNLLKKLSKALIEVGSLEEAKQYIESLIRSGDRFETVEDYVEDFKNYIADKSLEEHGEFADRVADVNADSSPLKESFKVKPHTPPNENQLAIYERYSKETGIPVDNLMAMVREAKEKMEEAITAKTGDQVHDSATLQKINKVSNPVAKSELQKAFQSGKTIDV